MALKSDRNELQTDISFFMNEEATRGGVVSISQLVVVVLLWIKALLWLLTLLLPVKLLLGFF